MGTFVGHEACPRCGSRDNLARYVDGSAWCFGCRYYEPANRAKRTERQPKGERSFALTAELPPFAVENLLQRGLTADEMKLFLWDTGMNRLVFKDGDFIEARSLSGATPKTLSFGPKPFVRVGTGSPYTCVEDIFSAIRVGLVCTAVPLFGSIVPKQYYGLLKGGPVVLWLDEDKYGEAIKQSRAMRAYGLDVRVVRTPLDPKEYSTEQVKEFLK